MIDRSYVEKAADSGLRKVTLLQTDPKRYMVRSMSGGDVSCHCGLRLLELDAQSARCFDGQGDRFCIFLVWA